ncbi:MAG: FG-GAP-like repeat-containing protein [Firmicutes bacterium]|nr:FG-GAP-like repeat-containing protein [Bacillota bacterium]
MRKPIHILSLLLLIMLLFVPRVWAGQETTSAPSGNTENVQTATTPAAQPEAGANDSPLNSVAAPDGSSATPTPGQSASPTGLPQNQLRTTLVVNGTDPFSSHEVDANGAFQYRYPLALPPGTNKMAPTLALAYCSHGENDILGVGWRLAGLPVITRDTSYPVTFDDTKDHYLYEGERLIYSNPAAGGDGYYHTERENFDRIELKNPNLANSYWLVTKKDGVKYYFGYQAAEHTAANDGHIDAIGQNGKARVWALSKVLDLQENYYVIEYSEDPATGAYYPAKITYTKNASHPLSGYRTIEFGYEDRADHWAVYRPAKVDISRRLKWITAKVGGNLYRKWRIDYTNSNSTGLSQMAAIWEYGSDGTTLPPVTFDWQDGTNGFDAPVKWGSNGGDVYPSYRQGDFNGDGRLDLLSIETSGGIDKFFVWLNNGTGFSNYQLWGTNGINDELGRYRPADFNGDGKTDLLVFEYNGGFYVWLSNGTGFNSPIKWGSNGRDVYDRYQLGDFNGDGLPDILSIEKSGGIDKFYVWLNTGASFSNYQMWGSNGINDDFGRYRPADFNGDGKTDLLVFEYNGGFYVWLNNGAGFNSPTRWGSNGNDIFYNCYRIADFNGDGLPDILSIEASGDLDKFFVWLNTGASFNTYQQWGSNGIHDRLDRYQIGDFNGDGRNDLLIFENNCGIYIWRSKGSSFEPALRWGSNGADIYWRYQIGDFNSDGKDDVISFESNFYFYVWKSSGLNPGLLKTIHLPTGGALAVGYLPAPQAAGAVAPGGKAYPNIANSYPRPLATQLSLHDGLGRTITTCYQYFDGVTRLGPPSRRAGLGFGRIRKTDLNAGKVTDTYYRQDDPDLRGRIAKEIQYGADGSIYLETRYKYAKRPIQDGVTFIYLTDEYRYNYNGETGSPVEYRISYTAYDNYGNVTGATNYGDTSTATDDVQQATEYNYYVNSTAYVTNLPSVERKYSPALNGENSLAAETRYYYTGYLLTRKELENGGQDVVLKYGYDCYGNQISATDGRNNTSTTTYDATYQTWVRYQTNPLGQTTETVYDSLMRPAQIIDPNGAVTVIQYDVFSREKARILPGDDSANPTFRITYWNKFMDISGKPLFPAREKTELKESGTGYLEKYGYYDGLGRLIQEKSETKAGWATVDYFYDNSGRQWKTSMPYITESYAYSSPDTSVKAKWAEYDPIGRESKLHNSDDTVTQKIYGKYDTLTVDPNGHVVNQRVIGNTEITITYNGVYPNQTEYARTTKLTAYDGIKVTDAKGNIFTTILDMLGRKTGENNPGMGVWSYEYDANNNLTSRTDGKNQTVSISYDALNRPTEKRYPDGTKVNYYYDEAGYGYSKGRVTRVVYPGGSESYYYDARGRKTSITQTIDGISKTQSMAYDSMDRVVTQTYPDGEVVTFSYEVDGNLKSISGSSVYVSSIEYTPLNKVSKIQYGNGVQTVYDYYDTAAKKDNSANTYFSYRLRGIQVSKPGASILNLQYEYDKANNVKVKRDLNDNSLTETYGYDAQDRLTSASAGAYGSKVFKYDQINNIIEKDGRTFSYNAGKPYAVADDGQYTYSYDGNGNMTGRSDGRVITWDYENRVSSVSDGGSFTYDAEYRRLKKVENGVTTLYFFNTYEEEYRGGNLTKRSKYYFVNDQRVAEQSTIDGLRYYHQDHLGSSAAITDASGNLALKSTYQPYGSDAFSQGGAVIDYKFTGKEKDGSGLYYFGARFYDPEIGRFISQDPAKDGLNWYSYCNNNPLKYVDPDGRNPVAVQKVIEAIGTYAPRMWTSVSNWVMTTAPRVANWAATNLDKVSDMVEVVKTKIVDAHNNAVVKDVVPAEFQKRVKNTFDGWINKITLKEDLTVYRYTSFPGGSSGYWFTTNGSYSPEEARELLALPDSNSATTVTAYIIPAGTTVLMGKTDSMVGTDGFGDYATGGGQQIYLPDPDDAILF